MYLQVDLDNIISRLTESTKSTYWHNLSRQVDLDKTISQLADIIYLTKSTYWE